MIKKTLTVAGLALNVFYLSDEEGEKGKEGEKNKNAETKPQKPVAILFLLHGRTSCADHMEMVAKAMLDELFARRKTRGGSETETAEAQGTAPTREEDHDLWIVTFVSALLSPSLCVIAQGRKGYCGVDRARDFSRITGIMALGR